MGRIITFWKNWIICKKKISQELDEITGRKEKKNYSEKDKKISKKKDDPSESNRSII